LSSSFWGKKSIHVYFALLCSKYSCVRRVNDCDVEFAVHGSCDEKNRSL